MTLDRTARLSILATLSCIGACTAANIPSSARTSDPAPELVARAPSVATGAEPAHSARPPAPFELRELDVEGFDPAVVSVPAGTTRRPLLVVAHGAGGRPEWHCEFWSQLVGSRGFVVCPRGKQVDQRVPNTEAGCYFPHHRYLTQVVQASIASLRAAYPDRLDEDRASYAGYSQGAIMGALMIIHSPAPFARALLIEGGGDQWNVALAERFHLGGGQRVAFLCGVDHCAAVATAATGWLKRADVEARVVHVPGGGHTAFGTVGERAPELFAWLVADDPRWQ